MDWPLVRRDWRALGSHCSVVLARSAGQSPAMAEVALDDAVAAVAAAEARFSRFLPTSELCALNASAGTWFTASDELWALVTTALDWARATYGIFDPTILPALRRAGYDRDYQLLKASPEQPVGRHQGAAAPRPASAGYARVALDPARQALRLPPGGAIDLGGIGKGWIADRLLEHLRDDWPDTLISLGGDLAVCGGPAAGRGWIIGISDPRQPEADPPIHLGGLEVRAGGIATSGASGRWWRQGDVLLHHLIDPRTGQPAAIPIMAPAAADLLAVTALAHTATAAEVHAKVALLQGRTRALDVLNGHLDHAGVAILGDGTLCPTANLSAYLGQSMV